MRILKLVVIVFLVGLAFSSPNLASHGYEGKKNGGQFLTNTNASYLMINLNDVPSEVSDGSTTNISVTIVSDDENGTLMNLAIEATAGLFENNESMISFQFAAANTTLYVLWTAPILTETDVDVTLTATGNLGDLEDIDSATVHVNAIFFDFAVGWQVQPSYFQNRTGMIGLSVTDKTDGLAVSDAEVTLNLEVGRFVSTQTSSILLKTDSNGSVLASVDFSSQEFVFDENEILVSATISKSKYHEFLTNTTITVIKSPPVPLVTVNFQPDVQYRVVIFTFNASLSGRAWINATFRVTATGGTFEDGTSNAIVKTNTSGLATIKWSAEGIPLVKDDITVFFTVELLTVDYGQVFEPVTYNFTLLGVETSLSLPSSTSDAGLSILPLALAIPILRRRRT